MFTTTRRMKPMSQISSDRAGEAEQIVDVRAAEPDQAYGDEGVHTTM